MNDRKLLKGNVLFVILIAIVLFSALTLVVGGMADRTKKAKGIGDEKIDLAVNELLQYAGQLKAAVHYIYTENGISEADIRFAHPDLNSAYGDPDSLDADQMVFHPSGGGIEYKSPPETYANATYLDWEFFGTTAAPQVGSDLADLLMVMKDVDSGFCTAINKKIGLSDIPTDTDDDGKCVGASSGARFSGSFSSSPNGMDDTSFSSLPAPAACVYCEVDELYHFYQVLLAR